MDIDSMFAFPTYELLLNTSREEVERSKIVQLGLGEPFALQCMVVGEIHEDPDLTWLKDGFPLVMDSAAVVDLPPESGSLGKSIVFSGFDTAKHAGVYECSVQRKDEKYHRKTIRLQQKPINAQIADGFVACPKKHEGVCYNGGICMMHKASNTISCLCPNDKNGPRCERFPVYGGDLSDFFGSPQRKAALFSMSATILAFLFLIIICCCYSMKQRRQIKRLMAHVDKSQSSTYPEQESSPLISMKNPQDNEVLAKLQSIDVRDDLYCWNCGSTQLSQVRPNMAAINAAKRATFFRDFSQPAESVYIMTNNETKETINNDDIIHR
uniref:Ig-like domain-containing protein n=1 Tax=Plectus sambesii TaxID=2011161 RepID=A0A914VN57_9BILA